MADHNMRYYFWGLSNYGVEIDEIFAGYLVMSNIISASSYYFRFVWWCYYSSVVALVCNPIIFSLGIERSCEAPFVVVVCEGGGREILLQRAAARFYRSVVYLLLFIFFIFFHVLYLIFFFSVSLSQLVLHFVSFSRATWMWFRLRVH